MQDHLQGALAGAAAAAVQLALGELGAVALRYAASPMRALGRWFIDLLPGPLVDVIVAVLEHHDKRLLLVTLVVGWVGAAALANASFGPVVAAPVVGTLGVLGIVASWRRPELRHRGAMGVAVAAAIVGPLTITFVPTVASVLLAASLAIVAVAMRPRDAVPRALPDPAVVLPPPPEGSELAVPGLSPLFTPNDRFYVTDVTFPPPRVERATWRLRVGGLVERPFELTYDELLAMRAIELDATLVCVHNPPGGPRIGTARWQGVPLAALLERAVLAPGADHVLARSVDGFVAGHPRSLIDAALVVYGMNREPLPREHGGPVRLLVPGVYGYDANVKWLEAIEVTRFEVARHTWQRKGWPRQVATVRTQARIDVPGSMAVSAGRQIIAGVAWSPPRGVTRVELSVDGGAWQTCELATELSPLAWRQWQHRWDATPGPHTLRVRAWSPDGVQEDTDGAPYPRGVAALHRAHLIVEEHGRAARRHVVRRIAEDLAARASLARAGLRAWKG